MSVIYARIDTFAPHRKGMSAKKINSALLILFCRVTGCEDYFDLLMKLCPVLTLYVYLG